MNGEWIVGAGLVPARFGYDLAIGGQGQALPLQFSPQDHAAGTALRRMVISRQSLVM